MKTTVFCVLEWAEASGRFDELVRAVVEERPRSEDLARLVFPSPDVSEIRRDFLLATTLSEIRRCLYRVDILLARSPHDLEGRELRDLINRALGKPLDVQDALVGKLAPRSTPTRYGLVRRAAVLMGLALTAFPIAWLWNLPRSTRVSVDRARCTGWGGEASAFGLFSARALVAAPREGWTVVTFVQPDHESYFALQAEGSPPTKPRHGRYEPNNGTWNLDLIYVGHIAQKPQQKAFQLWACTVSEQTAEKLMSTLHRDSTGVYFADGAAELPTGAAGSCSEPFPINLDSCPARP